MKLLVPKRALPTMLAAALVLASTAQADDWPQFRGTPSQQGVAGPLAAELAPIWTFRLQDGAETTAAIVGGVAYIGGLGGTFHALDLATGTENWSFAAPEQAEIKSSALVWGDTVYFGDEYGRLHALRTADGSVRWTFEAEGPITGAPTRAGDRDGGAKSACLIVGSYDNSIYCVDPDDGTARWRDETEGYIHGTPVVMADGRIVSSGCDGYLRALDLSGAETVELSIGSYVAASPAVAMVGDAERIVVGTFDNEVVGIDVGADSASSKVAWRYKHPRREFPFYSSPAVRDGLAVVGGRDKMIHALDVATGESRWTHSMRSRVDASPVISGDLVYVADQSGILRALRLADGTVAWEFQAADGFTGSPAVADGVLVIASLDGTVYAFGDAEKAPPQAAAPAR